MNRPRLNLFVGIAFISAVLGNFCSGIDATAEKSKSTLDPAFVKFVGEKETLAKALSKKYRLSVRPMIWDFFTAAKQGDWNTTSNLFSSIMAGSGRDGSPAWVPRQIWGSIHDTYGAYEQFHAWNPELLRRFGRHIIEGIPAGSIYFGGTDAGRFIVSALSQSHNEGRPIFTVTQNALADGTYLDYLREFYGGKIYIPTMADSQQAFQDYISDAQIRLAKKELKEDEQVSFANGRVTVNGEIAVMLVSERIVRVILEKNPGRDFFMEESFPLEGLYPNSVPHGLILQVSRQPVGRMAPAIIDADHKFWTKETRALLGNVLDENTSVRQLCAWTEKTHARSDLTEFTGSLPYLKDSEAPRYYSRCRSAIAALYQWRMKHSQDKDEVAVLSKEADFAHRQAVALHPYNPESVWRYVDFLLQQKRTEDAKVLIQTTLTLDPGKKMDLDSEALKKTWAKVQAKARELGISNPR